MYRTDMRYVKFILGSNLYAMIGDVETDNDMGRKIYRVRVNVCDINRLTTIFFII
jgi:hypothetical protein